MTTISVPLDPELARQLDSLVKDDVGSSRADVMRKALRQLARSRAIERIREAEADIKAGRVYTGDIDELIKHID